MLNFRDDEEEEEEEREQVRRGSVRNEKEVCDLEKR